MHGNLHKGGNLGNCADVGTLILELFYFYFELLHRIFVKLHSDLRILTQLQLVGVGPKEGRTVLWVSEGCMEIVWRVSGGCL